MSFERDNIRKLHAYVPGEQPAQATVVKLNTNENPYPPAPMVMQAVAEVTGEQLRRYPSPTALRFRQAAAQMHGLDPSNVIATNGGDELLRLLVTVFCEPGCMGIGMAQPSYSLYPVLGDIQDTRQTSIPLNDDFSLPDDFASRLNDAGCTLAFIVNPHAPSGRLQPIEQLRAIATTFKGVLVIDEAYVNFAKRDAIELLQDVEAGPALGNVVLLRTLSKGYSLAGLRFGYGLAHPELIAALDKARDSYNTDALSQAAAVAALESRPHAAQTWQWVIAERDRMTDALRGRGFHVFDSQSNFVLATHPGGEKGARSLYESLKQRSIFVRYFDQDRLRDKLRITIGSAEQDDALLAAIDDIR